MKQYDNILEEYLLDSDFNAKVKEIQADIFIKHVNYHKEVYRERIALERSKKDRSVRNIRRQLRMLLVRQ